MGSITRPYTYTTGNTITASENEANETTIYNEFNGNIDNNNVKAAAGIVESKISFDTAAGHDHDGSNSKGIAKGAMMFVVGTLTTGTSVAPIIISTASATISKVYLNVKTAPTGASILVDINKNGTSIWDTNQGNRVAIAAGATSGTETSFDTTALVEGDILTIDIDQVGSTVSGADLTVTIKT